MASRSFSCLSGRAAAVFSRLASPSFTSRLLFIEPTQAPSFICQVSPSSRLLDNKQEPDSLFSPVFYIKDKGRDPRSFLFYFFFSIRRVHLERQEFGGTRGIFFDRPMSPDNDAISIFIMMDLRQTELFDIGAPGVQILLLPMAIIRAGIRQGSGDGSVLCDPISKLNGYCTTLDLAPSTDGRRICQWPL